MHPTVRLNLAFKAIVAVSVLGGTGLLQAQVGSGEAETVYRFYTTMPGPY